MSVLLSPSPSLPKPAATHSEQPSPSGIHEFTDLQAAESSFINVITSLPGRSILLHCTVPTWSPSSESELYSSLDDLHQFRTRSLVFVHDICKKLGAAGIQVSYRLALSDSPLVLLRALPDDSVCTRDEHDALELVKRSSRERAIVTLLSGVPSIILT